MPNYTGLEGNWRYAINQQIECILDTMVEADKHHRAECGGYMRIPDVDKWKAHNRACADPENPTHGNCYESNTELFWQLVKDFPNLKLMVMNLSGDLCHCAILDGNIIIDHSQFKHRKMLASEYFEHNSTDRYVLLGKDDHAIPKTPAEARARFDYGYCVHKLKMEWRPIYRVNGDITHHGYEKSYREQKALDMLASM